MKLTEPMKAKLLLIFCMIIALIIIKYNSAHMYDEFKIDSDHTIVLPLTDTICCIRTDINR